jgi:hypothetical protein
MRRLKQSEVAEWRAARLAYQCGKCDLCKQPIPPGEDVADHDHATGLMRAVLHRSCNAALGKVENAIRRCGVRAPAAFLAGAWPYLQKHQTPSGTPVLHYTHKTPEEKRDLRNLRARKKRASKKGTA